MTGKLPDPVPDPTPETAAFWAATAEGRLLLSRCDECGNLMWYPRRNCPFCLGPASGAVEAKGTGSIYSYTVVHRGEGIYRDVVPYVLAYVELSEGLRLMSNVIGAPLDDLAVGDRVEVTFGALDGTSRLPRFRWVGPIGEVSPRSPPVPPTGAI